jgi:rod shape determining protein RodA
LPLRALITDYELRITLFVLRFTFYVSLPMTRENLRKVNWPILLYVSLLLTIGVAFIYSGSRILTGPEGDAIQLARAQKQIAWAGVGFAVLLLTTIPHYRTYVENAYVIYAGCLALLVLLLVAAQSGLVPTINGANRWIPLGFMNFQPSEVMKIALMLCLARYMQYRENHRTWLGLTVPFGLTLLPMVLIMKQPDLGTAMLFLPILFAVLFVAGSRVRHLAIIAGLAVCAVPLMYFLALQDYQRARITSFLRQSEVNSPAAMNELYQLIQSKLAVGSGGWFGKGWMEGTMNRLNFLPVRTTDFIFSVIGEEIGFVGLMAILSLFFLLFVSALGIADRQKEPSGRLIVIGTVALLASQLYINTAMTIGLMPVTGVTLPLVSYGGSSLITSFILVGLILNVGMRPAKTVAKDDFEFDDDILRRRRKAEETKWSILLRLQAGKDS